MAFKLKHRTQFPALVTVQSPLVLTKAGISYDFSIDANELAESVGDILTVGTASGEDTGTSGHTLPFLDGANTWSANQSITGSLVVTGVLGYTTGAGGTVTQATSKSTGVSLSKSSGAITMNNAALAAATIVSFTLTNTLIAATDVLVLNHISGGTVGSYTLNAQCAAGSATINVRNNTAGSLGEAIIIQFALIKGVNA